jgi:hypothetical protein
VVNALRQWLARTARLSPERRSAALFLADAVIDRASTSGWPIDDSAHAPLRRELNSIGARIGYVGGEDPGYVYYHNWLSEALRLAPGTRAGDLAFLTLAESGFSAENSSCGTYFRTIIARGTDYLHRYPASTIRGELHLLLAAAWGDVVTLASERSDDAQLEDAELAKVRREGPSASAHAIAEYTLGFRLVPNSPRARYFWPEAWRLMAGLPPSRTFFYCITD